MHRFSVNYNRECNRPRCSSHSDQKRGSKLARSGLEWAKTVQELRTSVRIHRTWAEPRLPEHGVGVHLGSIGLDEVRSKLARFPQAWWMWAQVWPETLKLVELGAKLAELASKSHADATLKCRFAQRLSCQAPDLRPSHRQPPGSM